MEWPWSLHIDVRQTTSVTYVRIEGDVNAANVNSLAFELDDLHDDPNGRIVFDLRGARMDEVGGALVARAEGAARDIGKHVTTLRPDPQILDRLSTR